MRYDIKYLESSGAGVVIGNVPQDDVHLEVRTMLEYDMEPGDRIVIMRNDDNTGNGCCCPWKEKEGGKTATH